MTFLLFQQKIMFYLKIKKVKMGVSEIPHCILHVYSFRKSLSDKYGGNLSRPHTEEKDTRKMGANSSSSNTAGSVHDFTVKVLSLSLSLLLFVSHPHMHCHVLNWKDMAIGGILIILIICGTFWKFNG